jgi:competence protein ComEC
MNKPLLALLLAFAAGTGLSDWPAQAQTSALLTLGILLSALGPNSRRWRQLSLCCVVSASCGLTWALLRTPRPDRQDIVHHVPVTGQLSGLLRAVKPRPTQWLLVVEAHTLRRHEREQIVSGRVIVSLPRHVQALPPTGSEIRLSGRAERPGDRLNFGEFSYRDYLAREGIFTRFKARELKVLRTASPNYLPGLPQQLRNQLYTRFSTPLSSEPAALLGSLVLGSDSEALPEPITRLFAQVGLQHVLAVSGFQVQLLLLAWLGLARLLRLNRSGTALSGCLLIGAYTALTGFPASVLRAGMVACLGLIAWRGFKQIHPLQALVGGAFLLLVWDPGLSRDTGFQFSCLATAGLICGSTLLAEKLDFLPLPITACLSGLLAAQVWVLPLQLYSFGTFSLHALPANLWAALWVSLLTWFTLGGLLLALFSPTLWALIAPLPEGLCRLFIGGVQWVATLPLPGTHTLFLSGMQLLLGLALLACLPCLKQSHMRRAFSFCLCALPLLHWQSALEQRKNCPLRVTWLYVGQGDSVLIEAEGKTLLLDAGPRQEEGNQVWDAGERYILPYLRRRGITQIDYAVISHAHLDHYGGFAFLAQQLPIKTFYAPAGSPASANWLKLERLLQTQQIPLRYPRQGEPLRLSDTVSLKFWQGTPRPTAPDPNNQSLVIRLQQQKFSILFAGDVESEAEARLARQLGPALKADILKVPHHGSDTSSTAEFLSQVQPREAIISAGVNNQFRHPVPEIVNRYLNRGSRVWRTDQQGAICVCAGGERYQIRTVQAD